MTPRRFRAVLHQESVAHKGQFLIQTQTGDNLWIGSLGGLDLPMVKKQLDSLHEGGCQILDTPEYQYSAPAPVGNKPGSANRTGPLFVAERA
jgi:hypothetical protein